MEWFLIWVIVFVTGSFVFWAVMEMVRFNREHKEKVIEYLTYISALTPLSPSLDYAESNRMAYELMLECSKKEWLEIRGAIGDCIPYLCKLCGYSNAEEVRIWHLQGGEKEASRRRANADKEAKKQKAKQH